MKNTGNGSRLRPSIRRAFLLLGVAASVVSQYLVVQTRDAGAVTALILLATVPAAWSIVQLERCGRVSAGLLVSVGIVLGISTSFRPVPAVFDSVPRLFSPSIESAAVVLREDIDLDRPYAAGMGRALRFSGKAGCAVEDDLPVELHIIRGGGSGGILLRGTEITAPVMLERGEGGVPVLTIIAGLQVTGKSRLAAIRYRFFSAVDRRLRRTPAEIAGLSKALLLGRRTELGTLFQERFRRSGASHVLALSGMHLAILAVILQTVLNPLFGRRISGLVVAMVLIGYTVLIGPLPSLVRADLAYLLAYYFRYHDIGLPRVDRLLLVIPLAQIVAPSYVFDVGFILSVASLLGIILFGEIWTRIGSRWLPRIVAQGLGISVAAFLFSAPVSLLVFGAIYPVGILVSAPLALVATLFMWNILMLLPLIVAPHIGTLLIRTAEFLYVSFVRITTMAARVPGLRCTTAGDCLKPLIIVAAGILIGIGWQIRLKAWKQNGDKAVKGGDTVDTRTIRPFAKKTVGPEFSL